jgi:CTD nuclear envelope phosphatase 1
MMVSKAELGKQQPQSVSGEFVEHSPSWSRAELFGQQNSAGRMGYKKFRLSQLLAAANEPSTGAYCLRNRLMTLSDISLLPSTAFPLPVSKRRKSSIGMSPFLTPTSSLMVTLVLDLDETLIFTTSESSGTCDLIAEVAQIDRPRAPPLLYYVHKRPYLDRFLAVVREWYRLAVYTASRAEYASIVCDWLDPTGNIFGGRRLFRDSCVERDGFLLKDLQLIESDLAKVCLIDNSPCSFLLCPDNAIPIAGWTLGSDRALMQLLPFLDALRFTKDVRSVLSLRRVM